MKAIIMIGGEQVEEDDEYLDPYINRKVDEYINDLGEAPGFFYREDGVHDAWEWWAW